MNYQIKASPQGYHDLIVAGGGISGICCAIAAARQGLHVLLIEKEGCLGGTACASGVMHLLGGRRYDAPSGRMVREIGGLFDELTDELIAQGEAIDPDSIDVRQGNPYGWYPRMAAGIACEVDALKVHLEKKCIDAGVELRYYSTVVAAQVQKGQIKSLLVQDKGGFSSFEARLFADCTGDADLAALCACPTQTGRAEDGAMGPATLIFYVDHVDTQAYLNYQNTHQSPKLVEIIERLKQEGRWHYLFEIFIAIKTPQEDVFMVNTLRQTDVDGRDAHSLTQAAIDGRRMAYELLEIMRNEFPGFEQAKMRRIFDRVGIRETRRISARQMISLNDALEGRKYDDCVASTTYNFDLPDPKRPSYDPMMGDAKQPNATRKHTRISIPYGALLPQNVENLIVAGRCLGADREVMGACRVMGPCAQMGQAAGNAAYLALSNADFSTVDTTALRAMMIDQGNIGLS